MLELFFNVKDFHLFYIRHLEGLDILWLWPWMLIVSLICEEMLALLCMIVYNVVALLVKWYIPTHLGWICMGMFIWNDGFGKYICVLYVCVCVNPMVHILCHKNPQWFGGMILCDSIREWGVLMIACLWKWMFMCSIVTEWLCIDWIFYAYPCCIFKCDNYKL